MRNLKTLGVAFVAMLALTAVVASAAQASSFTAAEYPAKVTGEQLAAGPNKLTLGSSSVTCSTGNYAGTLAGASSTLEVSLDYTGCKTSFETEATVDNNGCTYLFHSGASTGTDKFAATADLKCPAGQELTVTLGLCTVHIAPQNGLTGVTLTNNTGSPGDVTVTATTAVTVNVTNVFLCPLSTGSQTATLDANVTVKAYKDTGGTEGAQLNALVD